MTATSIEWTDHSANPLRARLGRGDGHYCEKISPGCKHCYASRMQPRFRMPQFKDARGKVEHYLEKKVLFDVLRRRKPTKYFWCDMTDMFGHWVPNEWIAACFGIMAATPWHTHQLLTKRPERMREWFRWVEQQDEDGPYRLILGNAADHCKGALWEKRLTALGLDTELPECEPWPLTNVWLGTSIENQAESERLLDLAATPAWIRFISAEPLLEKLELGLLGTLPKTITHHQYQAVYERIHWVIVGGESGQKARPFDLDWGRAIVKECAEASVACFVKQLGAKPVGSWHADGLSPDREQPLLAGGVWRLTDRKGGNIEEFPPELRVRQFPEILDTL